MDRLTCEKCGLRSLLVKRSKERTWVLANLAEEAQISGEEGAGRRNPLMVVGCINHRRKHSKETSNANSNNSEHNKKEFQLSVARPRIEHGTPKLSVGGRKSIVGTINDLEKKSLV